MCSSPLIVAACLSVWVCFCVVGRLLVDTGIVRMANREQKHVLRSIVPHFLLSRVGRSLSAVMAKGYQVLLRPSRTRRRSLRGISCLAPRDDSVDRGLLGSLSQPLAAQRRVMKARTRAHGTHPRVATRVLTAGRKHPALPGERAQKDSSENTRTQGNERAHTYSHAHACKHRGTRVCLLFPDDLCLEPLVCAVDPCVLVLRHSRLLV